MTDEYQQEIRQPSPGEWSHKLKDFKVLVAGASGKTGRCVVETLVSNNVPVRALVRDIERGKAVLPSARDAPLDVVQADVFQYATLPRALGDANAIIICTGTADPMDPMGPFNVDFQGTVNLVELAKQKGVKKIVLVSSIGADTLLNPLNLFWGVLFWKKRAEEAIQRSGIDYTIVRPGGLKSKLRDNETSAGNIVMKGPGSFDIRPTMPPTMEIGSILRKQVAEVCVAALVEPAASNKVVEVIARGEAPERSMAELFESVQP